jgi:hypothetical protein
LRSAASILLIEDDNTRSVKILPCCTGHSFALFLSGNSIASRIALVSKKQLIDDTFLERFGVLVRGTNCAHSEVFQSEINPALGSNVY